MRATQTLSRPRGVVYVLLLLKPAAQVQVEKQNCLSIAFATLEPPATPKTEKHNSWKQPMIQTCLQGKADLPSGTVPLDGTYWAATRNGRPRQWSLWSQRDQCHDTWHFGLRYAPRVGGAGSRFLSPCVVVSGQDTSGPWDGCIRLRWLRSISPIQI